MRPPRRLLGKKLLVASIGVAAINYTACTEQHNVGNLMAPPDRSEDAGAVDPLGSSPEHAANADAAPTDNGGSTAQPVATGTSSAAPAGSASAAPTGSSSAAVVATGTPPKPTASAVPTIPIPRPPHAGNLMAPRPIK